jgi:hypothetical protein
MHRVAIGLCLATALGVSLAAQAGNPPAGQQPPSTTAQPATPPATPPAQPPSSAAASAGEMTLTGCLQKGAEGNFTLTNVQADAKSGSGGGAAPTGTAGATTPGAASSAAPAGATSTWSLKGGSDLANHVGHRIAVTGKAAAASAASGSTPGATTAPPATTTAGSSSSSMRTLEVASVKMIAATCP